MKLPDIRLRDCLFALLVLVVTFVVNVIIHEIFKTRTLIPMIFVLGIFIIAWKTEGYIVGIISSLVSVLAVNYAFTFPYYAFDLLSPECLFSAVVMLIIATMTSTLTTRIKLQEIARAETELEQMRANLLRAVSHDLRTPLTGIYGSAEAIIDNYDSLSKEQKLKLLTDIKEDGQWLIHMVENLLSVTRIDNGNVQLSKTPVVLEELVDSVLMKFRKRYPSQEITVDIPEEFISIPMDVLLIEQVIINLFENAVIHATDMTELVFRVYLMGGNAVFEISDNGCGIPRELLSKVIVGSHIRHDDAPSDGSRRNMGIGLSVCTAIVKAHGGTLTAENKKEGGAVFRFELKTEEDNEQQ